MAVTCAVISADEETEERHTERPVRRSKRKQNVEVKGKKISRKKQPSPPSELVTPIPKKRRLSVSFKKQARPRSCSSAVIPIDDLALKLTPGLERKTKSEGFKGRNSGLKRKRFVMEEMKKVDEGYQDDIYESKTFDHFKEMLPTDLSDTSEALSGVKTPKLASLLTPGIWEKTPAYRDCFSPTEYAENRKIAEECMYRNKKKKRSSQVETPDVPEKKKLEFNEAVERALAFQQKVQNLSLDSSDKEDYYFNDDT